MTVCTIEPLLDAVIFPRVVDAAVDQLRKENESHARAMPLQRLLGGGMEYADAVTLLSLGNHNARWVDVACWLAERHLSVARKAEAEGRTATARSSYHYASACFRFGHAAIATDTSEKREIYGKMDAAFGSAARQERFEIKKMRFAFRTGYLCGWLVKPHQSDGIPLVICLGGFDGWREEYFHGAEVLAERGIATLLLDGLGQGETRLVHRLFLDQDFSLAVSKVLDHLSDDPGFTSIGVWGNSMGGFLAAACAIRDRRFNACCVNGGTIRPAEVLDRYPRFITKVQAILGVEDPAEARAAISQFDIGEYVDTLDCPLLQFHGEPDQVFLLSNARRIYDQARSTDKTLMVWRDGDHCIYNHTYEKYSLLGDWFASRLSGSRI
ncbi:alpha/beta hydrolase family protein [Cupriavidus necator]